MTHLDEIINAYIKHGLALESMDKAPKEIYITSDFAQFTNLDKPVPNKECIKYIRADLAEEEYKRQIELIKKSWYSHGYIDGKYKMAPQWILKNLQYEENPNYGKELKETTNN